MSGGKPETERRQEIIIVRRKKRGGDGHHGGAWKIAFADFMTAMMALFLVLWLVNAANEETKKSVASYFNPVKLVDRYRSERGLSPADGPVGSQKNGIERVETAPENELQDGASDTTETDDLDTDGEASTAAFFANAEAVLADMTEAAQAELRMAEAPEDPAFAPATDQLRDPFATGFTMAALASETIPEPVEERPEAPASAASETPVEAPQTTPDATPAEPPASAFERPEAPETADATPDASPDDEAVAVVREALAKASGGDLLEQAQVSQTPEGTLIALVDATGQPMFERSSAHPTQMLVTLLAGLSQTITKDGRRVRISGHTDATPYRSSTGYDNWRLSTDRANAARLILEQSGVDAGLIASVGGFSDRRPIRPDDRFAAENRRIEILLETGV